MPGIEIVDGRRDLLRRTVALDPDRVDNNMDVGKPATDHVEEIADGGPGDGGDQADSLGKNGKRLFVVGIEQALFLEFAFQFLERGLERAETLGQEVVDDDLVLAGAFVDADVAVDQHFQPVGQVKLHLAGGAAEHDGCQLGLGVFQGEIDMAGRRPTQVGDFALDPDIRQFLLEQVLDLPGDLADGKRFGGWGGHRTRGWTIRCRSRARAR